jgi:hypothetical protein
MMSRRAAPDAPSEGIITLGQLYPDGEQETVLRDAGFARVRRAAQTPFNRIFEARP